MNDDEQKARRSLPGNESNSGTFSDAKPGWQMLVSKLSVTHLMSNLYFKSIHIATPVYESTQTGAAFRIQAADTQT